MRVVLTVGAFLLLAAVATHSKFAGHSAAPETAPATATPVAEPAPDGKVNAQEPHEAPADIKVVLLALRPEGFEPNELQLPAGEYLFVVRNRTGLDEVDLSFRQEAGEQVGSARALGRGRDWKERIKLTPGTYVISETGHADWNCRLIVER